MTDIVLKAIHAACDREIAKQTKYLKTWEGHAKRAKKEGTPDAAQFAQHVEEIKARIERLKARKLEGRAVPVIL